MYDYGYTPTLTHTAPATPDRTWLIISAVIAIIGGIVAYFLFVAKPKTEDKGFVSWLHDFLNFKVYFVEMILKITYIIAAIFITLGSFSLITSSVVGFFMMLIFGNIIARITYEFLLMTITLVNNTTEINKKLGNKEEKKAKSKEEK